MINTLKFDLSQLYDNQSHHDPHVLIFETTIPQAPDVPLSAQNIHFKIGQVILNALHHVIFFFVRLIPGQIDDNVKQQIRNAAIFGTPHQVLAEGIDISKYLSDTEKKFFAGVFTRLLNASTGNQACLPAAEFLQKMFSGANICLSDDGGFYEELKNLHDMKTSISSHYHEFRAARRLQDFIFGELLIYHSTQTGHTHFQFERSPLTLTLCLLHGRDYCTYRAEQRQVGPFGFTSEHTEDEYLDILNLNRHTVDRRHDEHC